MKTLFAAAALSVSSLVMAAPAASASAEDAVSAAGSLQLHDYVAGSVVEPGVDAARPICAGHGNITGAVRRRRRRGRERRMAARLALSPVITSF